MAETASRIQLVIAWIAVIAIVALISLGLLLYGFSAEVNHRIWRDILERPGGPMTFRFILQPCMAAVAALVDGINDARLSRDPYLWTILTERSR